MMKKSIRTIFLFIIICFGFALDSSEIFAADGTVKIFLGDSTVPRHHKAIVECGKSEELFFKLKKGTVKSSSFKSDNENSFKISKNNGKEYIDAIKEGTGYVILTIKTTDNNIYTERLFISVYRKVEKSIGIALEKLTVYRGASENANVENEDAKGEIQKDKDFYVIAMCEDFYLIQTKDGSKFVDDYDTGFVRKKKIKIPISRIELNKTSLSLVEGQEFKLTAKVLPEYTTENKKITWSSTNKDLVVVYSDGAIYAKKSGIVDVIVTSGATTNTCKVDIKKLVDSSIKKKSKRLKAKIKKKYRYSFINSEKAFGKKYELSNKLRNKLANKLYEAGYFESKREARVEIDDMLAKEWRESCYGIAITTALNRKKQINVRKYTKASGKGYQIDKVVEPVNNKDTANIINYYYTSQIAFNREEDFYDIDDKENWKEIIKCAKKGYIQSFGFAMLDKTDNTKESRHRILIVGFDKKKTKKSKKWIYLKIYDNSYSYEDRYMRISKKYDKVRIQGWSKTKDIVHVRSNDDFEKYLKIKIK